MSRDLPAGAWLARLVPALGGAMAFLIAALVAWGEREAALAGALLLGAASLAAALLLPAALAAPAGVADLESARTALREAHPELVDLERFAAVQGLAGEVAHAINNPLAVIQGRLQMRLERTPPDPEDARLLILSRRIGDVVAGMLELSERGRLHPREVEATEIVHEATRGGPAERARAADVKLRSWIDPELGELFADPPHLVRALSALLDNALDATRPGGEIRVEVQALGESGYVRISVGDDGAGMDPAACEHASDAFFSTRPGRAGLGLTFARSIAEAHGGRLTLDSAPERGTRAALELPILALWQAEGAQRAAGERRHKVNSA